MLAACSDGVVDLTASPKAGRRMAVHVPPRRTLPCLAGRVHRIAVGVAVVLLSLHLLLCVVLAAREWRARWEPADAASAPPTGAPGRVPKIIHQMYKTAELPDKWRDVRAAWAALHPADEYTYMLWTDDELRALIASDYPWLLPGAYPYATQRWDASRLAILHK